MNHALEQRFFSIKEKTIIFLSHHDKPRYKVAVKGYKATIHHLSTVLMIYMVPAITGTLDQVQPMSWSPTHPRMDTTTNRARIQTANDWEGYK